MTIISKKHWTSRLVKFNLVINYCKIKKKLFSLNKWIEIYLNFGSIYVYHILFIYFTHAKNFYGKKHVLLDYHIKKIKNKKRRKITFTLCVITIIKEKKIFCALLLHLL